MTPDHQNGDMVYLKTDTEQLPRMVTGYTVRPTGITYLLSCAGTETQHYAIEISREKTPANGNPAGFGRTA